MSRMAETWQEQQEQENESGLMNDAYHVCHPLEKSNLQDEQKPAEEK